MDESEINNQFNLVANKLHVYINDTRVVAVQKRQYYTLTQTSVPNHTSHITDMKYGIDQINTTYRIID